MQCHEKRGVDNHLGWRRKKRQLIFRLVMIYSGFSADTTIAHRKQRGRKIHPRDSTFVARAYKSCDVLNDASADNDEFFPLRKTVFFQKIDDSHNTIQRFKFL